MSNGGQGLCSVFSHGKVLDEKTIQYKDFEAKLMEQSEDIERKLNQQSQMVLQAISQLKGLESLYLSNNKIESFQEEICYLSRLTILKFLIRINHLSGYINMIYTI